MFLSPEITEEVARDELTRVMGELVLRTGEMSTLEEVALGGKMFVVRTTWNMSYPDELKRFALERLPGRGNPIRRAQVAFQPRELGLKGVENYHIVVNAIAPRIRPSGLDMLVPTRYGPGIEEYGGELIELFPDQQPMGWAISLNLSEQIPLPPGLPTRGQDLDPKVIYGIARMLPGIPNTIPYRQAKTALII